MVRNLASELLFKLLMTKVISNTRATMSHLQENFTNIDSYMTTVNSNIDLFDPYVKENQQGLKARGSQLTI
eukprot:5633633-Ditylum_brightwellii.AAC.1